MWYLMNFRVIVHSPQESLCFLHEVCFRYIFCSFDPSNNKSFISSHFNAKSKIDIFIHNSILSFLLLLCKNETFLDFFKHSDTCLVSLSTIQLCCISRYINYGTSKENPKVGSFLGLLIQLRPRKKYE